MTQIGARVEAIFTIVIRHSIRLLHIVRVVLIADILLLDQITISKANVVLTCLGSYRQWHNDRTQVADAGEYKTGDVQAQCDIGVEFTAFDIVDQKLVSCRYRANKGRHPEDEQGKEYNQTDY